MYKVSNKYKEVIYSGDAKHKLKLLFNNIEYEQANVTVESVKVTSKILSNGNERFSLDNFVSKECEIIIHDLDENKIVEPISISIGTLVDEEYEYVPIGIFNISEKPKTDKNKTTLKLRDNSVKLDYPYDGGILMEKNGGSATMKQILQDICEQFELELGVSSFANQDTQVSVYDNTINARQYVMDIAEKAGCIATIDRLGRLIFIDLNKEADIEIISSDNTIYINDALDRNINSLTIYGKSEQDGTPTPDNPVDIKNVEISNLLKNKVNSQTINDITFTINDDKSVTMNGTATANTYLYLNGATGYTENIKKGIYTLSGCTTGSSSTYQLQIHDGTTYYSCRTVPINITINENKTYRSRIVVLSGTTINNVTIYPMLEKGTIAHDYVPYGNWLKINNKGKNLLKNSSEFSVSYAESQIIDETYNNCKVRYLSTENITTSYKEFARFDNIRKNYNIDFKKGSIYTFSFWAKSSKQNNVICYFYGQTGYAKAKVIKSSNGKTQASYGDGNWSITDIGSEWKRYWVTWEINPNATDDEIQKEKILLIRQMSGGDLYVSGCSLIEGDGYYEYEPYRNDEYLINLQDNELCSIGEVKDEIDITTGTLTKRIGKVVLNGSENWHYYSNLKRFFVDGLINCKKESFRQPIISNYYRYLSSGHQDGIMFAYYDGNKTQLMLYDYDCITEEQLKNKLQELYNAGTPVTVYYILAEPEIIQLEPNEIMTYKGDNNIKLLSGLNTNFKINYQQEKKYIELDPLLMEQYTEGEELTITRVVYEDAIRKFEFGNDDGVTLYINTSNPFITSELEIENIFNLINNFSICSMKINKIIGNPAIDSYDIIKFTYNDKTYKTLAQNVLTYNGVCMHNFETQIGTTEKAQENVTLNSDSAKFKRLFTRIDQAEGNIEITASQVTSVQTDLKENYYTLEQTNQLIENAETGVTNTFSEAGGNNIFRNTGLWFENSGNDSQDNPYEFWNGKVARQSEIKASNKNALLLQNDNLFQEQEIPNGNYTISFKYKKLIELSDVKVYINDEEFILDKNVDTEFIETVQVNSQHINIRFVCNVDNGCEVYDLMVNAGSVKLAYSQNQNETTTDTVNISKGITITSSSQKVKFKADADGIRVLPKDSQDLSESITEFTETGMTTKKATIEEDSQIVRVLFQNVGEHTWLTRL